MSWICVITTWIGENPELTVQALTLTILLIALIIAVFTLRSMRHDRATSIAMTLSQSYDSGTVLEGRTLLRTIQIWQESHGIQDKQQSFLNTVEYYKQYYPEEYAKLISVPAFFDLIGWLVRRNCCDARSIDEQLDWETPYKIWEPYIRWIQNKQKAETLDDKPTAICGNFVWLVNELKRQQ